MLTMESLAMSVCCVCEKLIQDSSGVIQLTAHVIPLSHFLLTSEDGAAQAAGQHDVVVMIDKDEATVFGPILGNRSSCFPFPFVHFLPTLDFHFYDCEV